MKHIERPSIVAAAGNKPKIIEEYVGHVNSATSDVSVARMKSPSGWVEPGQTPEFGAGDERCGEAGALLPVLPAGIRAEP